MCERSTEETPQQLTLFAEDSPARTFPLPDAARAWLESEAAYGLSFVEFWRTLDRHGLLSRMSPACYRLTEEGTLPSSFTGWGNSGISRPGACLTLSTTEWHKNAVVCSLSQVSETDVPRKYFLSARACRGILRRAERRGKKLPPLLEQVLQAVAMGEVPLPQKP